MESEKVKETKKALECCANCNGQSRCKDCPIFAKCYEDENFMPRLALTLINELESENKRLKWENQVLEDKDTLLKKLGKMVQENQQLKDRIAELESDNKRLQDLCNKTYEDLTKEIDRLENRVEV